MIRTQGLWVCLSACLLGWIAFVSFGGYAFGEDAKDPKQIVQQAVLTELAANRDDHSRWLYFEVDRKPKNSVTQWVAETPSGDVDRVLEQNAKTLSTVEQQKKMDDFRRNSAEQERRRKAGKHDDDQATKLLKLLPNAFLWTSQGSQSGRTTLHFKPDAKFDPPDREARVFASMEGDMIVDDAQHRIVSLKGHLIRDVKFGGGLFAELKAGGSFNVERRETGPRIWQITETHVHIQGHALLFKSISEQEDDVKTKFKQLPDNLSLEAAEKDLLEEAK